MATNDGMVRKVGWLLVSHREKVFSCGTARSVCGASEDCGACLVTLDQRAEDDGGDQGMNSTQPKIRYGRKAALRTSYGF